MFENLALEAYLSGVASPTAVGALALGLIGLRGDPGRDTPPRSGSAAQTYSRMKKARILFVVPRFSVGGAEKLLVHFLTALDREKYEPVLVTIFDEQKDSLANQVHIDRCFYFRSTWDIGAFFRLYTFVRKGKFNVVVTHLFSANLLARAAAILARTPAIVSYEHNIYPNKRRWQIFMDSLLGKWTDRIIVDSEAARVFTAKQERIPLEKFAVVYIPPLFDTRPRRSAEVLRRDLGIPEGAPVVLSVSRLVEDKGHRYLIDAAPKILEKHENTHILIGGWGPLQGDLEKQARSLSLDTRVRLLGRVDGQEMLQLADVYVDPSISTDLPIGIMEAMKAGKPIVATSVGDIPAFVGEGKTGRIVAPYDAKALAYAIIDLLGDEESRARLGRAASDRVADLSLDTYMKQFDAVIREILS
ncbi:glycosyltransferase family 4 protein [Candidatus Kaiserbacteria bacterium]|nr:glycosyltransferase family 4 protein [Candidatus Kaiserbacteria bacterium]